MGKRVKSRKAKTKKPQSLWLADFDEDQKGSDWLIFASDHGDWIKAEKRFLKIYKTEYNHPFSNPFGEDVNRGFDVHELKEVDGYKIKLVE